jgi:ketosteroid isomerase-like protein
MDAYMATWERSLSWSEKPVAFDFHDVKVTARSDMAFATAIGRCAGVDLNDKRQELEFRLKIGFRKIDGSVAGYARAPFTGGRVDGTDCLP